MKNGAFLHWIKVSNGETSGLLDNITNDNKEKEVQNLEDEIETELNCPTKLRSNCISYYHTSCK